MRIFIAVLFLLIATPAHSVVVNAIIKTSETVNLLDPTWQAENPGVVFEWYRLSAEWADNVTPGTVVYNGEKIYHFALDVDGSDFLVLVEGLLIAYDFGELLGMQSMGYDVPAIWDTTDLENPVLVQEAKALTYKALDPAILNYLEEREIKDDSEPPVVIGTQTKELNWTHTWEKMAPWVYW